MMTLAWPWVLALVLFPWMVRRWAPPVSNSSGRAMKVPHFEDIMTLSVQPVDRGDSFKAFNAVLGGDIHLVRSASCGSPSTVEWRTCWVANQWT